VIYLDHHAATPLLPEVRAAMAAAPWANPSSVHAAGREARRALEEARAAVAGGIGAKPADVVLTSGGTEACNLMVHGLRRRRVVTTRVEHPAVLRAVGDDAVLLDVPRGVPPSPAEVAEALTADTLLAVQHVNHETGTVFPVAQYAEVARAAGATFVVDASQALGRVPLDVRELGAHAVALTAQKIGGPAGAGALWVSREVELAPAHVGGAQERGRRAGTQDVRAHAGFAEAMRRLPERLAAMPRVAGWRDALEATLVARGAEVNGEGPRVASVVDASVPHWRSGVLVAALDVEGLACSAGAACSSGVDAPSAVVEAMYGRERAEQALRLSLGPEDLDDAKVHAACSILERVLRRAKAEARP